MKRRERQKEGRNETMRKHITKIFVLFLAAIVASGAYLPGMVNRVYADEVEEAAVVAAQPSEDVYAFVERMYVNFLGRGSDPAGKENWATQLANGQIDSVRRCGRTGR